MARFFQPLTSAHLQYLIRFFIFTIFQVMSDHAGLSSTKNPPVSQNHPRCFPSVGFHPLTPQPCSLPIKTPLFLAAFGVEPNLSGITECHYSTPTSVHQQWRTRMNTSLIESMRRTPHTPCLNCGTHGGYSPVGSRKESPTSLSSHPSVY